MGIAVGIADVSDIGTMMKPAKKPGPHLISRLAKIGYYEWDETNDCYLDVSSEMAAMYGESREDFLAKYGNRQDDIDRWVHPDDIDRYDAIDQYYVENPQPYSIEYRAFSLSGEIRYVIESLEPDWDENGRVTRWFGIIQDITDRVLREQEREAELRKAITFAEDASQAKSAFLASMSHELRTPMNAILGFSQLLASDPVDPISDNQQNYVKHILENGDHLMALIDQVLELAKIETGPLPLAIRNVDIAAAIKECLSMVLPLAQKRHVTLVTDSTTAVPQHCQADPGLLRQVLLNLVSNAIKYNVESGRIQLTVSKRSGNRVRIAIVDTGRGIPIEKQKQVFEPFNRLGLEASNIRGTGIGLTIVKQLIERMNGTVGFESTPDVGSTFWIELPMAGPAST